MLHDFTNGLVGLLATKGIRRWMGTLDFRAYLYDPSVDPVLAEGPPRIYIFWHENILFPLYLRGRCHFSMLLSQHRDADILNRIAYLMGFGTVRGSTYRGGAKALLQLVERSEFNHLTLTPDGPRGPRRQLAPGPIFLASKLGLPLVAMGYGYDRPWRARSWDRFAIPKPFSRARAILSPAIHVPPDLDREGLEAYQAEVERLMNDLTDEAEAWATSGERRSGERVLRAEPAAPPEKLGDVTAGINQPRRYSAAA